MSTVLFCSVMALNKSGKDKVHNIMVTADENKAYARGNKIHVRMAWPLNHYTLKPFVPVFNFYLCFVDK